MTVEFIDGGIPRLNLYASFVGQIKHYLKAAKNRFVAVGITEMSEGGSCSAVDMAIPTQKAGYYTVQVKADDVDYCALRLMAEVMYGEGTEDSKAAMLDPDGYGLCNEDVFSPNIAVVNTGTDDIYESNTEKYFVKVAKEAFEPYRTEYFIVAVNDKTRKDPKNIRIFYVCGENGLIFKDVDYTILYPSPDTKERVKAELDNIESLTYNAGYYDNCGYSGNYNNGNYNNTSIYDKKYDNWNSSVKVKEVEAYVDAKINEDNPPLESLT